MASEEDNFDIDVYGDGVEEFAQEDLQNPETDVAVPQLDGNHEDLPSLPQRPKSEAPETKDQISATTERTASPSNAAQKITSTDNSTTELVQLPKQAPQMQGLKRKEGEEDNRNVDPNATTALYVSDLHWWITDDDIRGWANQSRCEDELEDITFNEHKVNGKSKG